MELKLSRPIITTTLGFIREKVLESRLSRPIITTTLGFIFGLIFMLCSRYMTDIAFWPIGISFLLLHTVMGLVIGINKLRLHWMVHGMAWGAAFGLFLAVILFRGVSEPWLVYFAFVISGFLIETLTTKVFRQPK